MQLLVTKKKIADYSSATSSSSLSRRAARGPARGEGTRAERRRARGRARAGTRRFLLTRCAVAAPRANRARVVARVGENARDVPRGKTRIANAFSFSFSFRFRTASRRGSTGPRRSRRRGAVGHGRPTRTHVAAARTERLETFFETFFARRPSPTLAPNARCSEDAPRRTSEEPRVVPRRVSRRRAQFSSRDAPPPRDTVVSPPRERSRDAPLRNRRNSAGCARILPRASPLRRRCRKRRREAPVSRARASTQPARAAAAARRASRRLADARANASFANDACVSIARLSLRDTPSSPSIPKTSTPTFGAVPSAIPSRAPLAVADALAVARVCPSQSARSSATVTHPPSRGARGRVWFPNPEFAAFAATHFKCAGRRMTRERGAPAPAPSAPPRRPTGSSGRRAAGHARRRPAPVASTNALARPSPHHARYVVGHHRVRLRRSPRGRPPPPPGRAEAPRRTTPRTGGTAGRRVGGARARVFF